MSQCPTGQNHWCVPFVFAKLMGCTTNEVAALITDIRVRQVKKERGTKPGGARVDTAALRRAQMPVAGVYGYEQEWLRAELGITVTAAVHRPGMSIRTWATARKYHGDTKPWIVHSSTHAAIYKDGLIYENINPEGIDVMNCRMGRCRLTSAEQVDVWDDANPYKQTCPTVFL
jgi:hypothetical protein